MSDYYKILGVPKDSNQIQIRKAFRTLALRYHPDKNKNSEESKQKFIEIVEAYEVLSDDKANAGLWKATFILLGSLGLVSVFIILRIH